MTIFKSYLKDKKPLYAIILGLLTFFFSPNGHSVTIGDIYVNIVWSVIFSLIAALAFGPRYGILSGLAGGAYFPYYLWANNGYANILNMFLLLSLYFSIGQISTKIKNPDKSGTLSPLFIRLALFLIVMSFSYGLLFNYLLSFNPPFWSNTAVNSLPQNLLNVFIVKDIINYVLLVFFAELLLRINFIRSLFGLEKVSYMAFNHLVLFYTIITIILLGFILQFFIHLFSGTSHEVHSSIYDQLQFVLHRVAIPIARIIFYFSETRLQSEIELRINKEKYFSLFDNAAIPIWEEDFSEVKKFFNSVSTSKNYDWEMYFINNPAKIVHCAGLIKILNVNLTSLKFFGVTSKEMLYDNLPSYFTEDSFPVFKDELVSLAKGESSFECEIPIKDLSGDTRYLILKLVVVEENKTDLSKVLISFVDITDRKIAESELEKHRNHLEELVNERTQKIDSINKKLITEIELKDEAEKNLEIALGKEKELNQLKSKFISTASHEFRTPLTSIMSSSQMVDKYLDSWDANKIRTHLKRIQDSAFYLTHLMDDVIKINHAESGRMTINKKLINYRNYLTDLTESHKLVNKHEILLNYSCPQEEYTMDHKQLDLILSNLLSNADKYSNENSVIIVSTHEKANFLVIEIIDQGIGISESELNKIFDPFYRAANAELYKGSGLGLSIVKNSVELLGGSISVESQINIGTSFTVSLPIYN